MYHVSSLLHCEFEHLNGEQGMLSTAFVCVIVMLNLEGLLNAPDGTVRCAAFTYHSTSFKIGSRVFAG